VAAPRLFLSSERPYFPDTPGAIVKIELHGTGAIDVRLYRVADPERFLIGQKDLERLDLHPRGATAAPRRRIAAAALADAMADIATDLARSARASASPLARSLFRKLMPDDSLARPGEVPFLQGWELVDRWRLPCGHVEAESEIAYCDLDVGPRPSGLYIVEGVYGRDVGYTLAVVSRLGLLARGAGDRIAALAVDSRTGVPFPGVQITFHSDGAVIARGTSGKDGSFSMKLPHQLHAVARAGPDVAILDLERQRTPVVDRRFLVMTDRSNYAPGDTLRYKIVGRTTGGDSPRGDIVVTLEDGRGSVLQRETKELSPAGTVTGQAVIPDGVSPGAFRLVAFDNHAPVPAQGGGELWVRRAPEPEIVVDARIVADTGRPPSVEAQVLAHGRPVPKAPCSYQLSAARLTAVGQDAFEELERDEIDTGPDGRARITFDRGADYDAQLAVDLECRDPEGRIGVGHAESTRIVGTFRTLLTTDRKLYAPGQTATVSVQTLTAQGAPRSASVRLSVIAFRALPGGESGREEIVNDTVRSDADGRVEFHFAVAQAGYYVVEAYDGIRRVAETFVYASSEGGDIPETPEALTIVQDKSQYAAGETARILILTPFEAGSVFVTVEAADIVRHEVLAVHGYSAATSVKITQALAPNFQLSALGIFAGNSYRREQTIHVGSVPELQVRIEPEQAVAAPGDEVLVRVEVLDHGRPAPSADVALWAIDAAEGPPAFPWPTSFFHPDRRSLGEGASSTSLRLSSYSRPLRTAMAEEDVVERFKSAGVERPRVPTLGVATFSPALVTDARGHTSARVRVPSQGGVLALRAVAASGPLFGHAESAVAIARGVSVRIDAPAVAAPGDSIEVRARLLNLDSRSQSATLRLLGGGTTLDRSIDLLGGAEATLPVRASMGDRPLDLSARLAPGASVAKSIRQMARQGPAIRRAGILMPGTRVDIGSPGGEGPLSLTAASQPRAIAHLARSALGDEATGLVDVAVSRVLARIAEGQAGSSQDPEWQRGARLDMARLVALARPDGTFGAFDGGSPDRSRTARALIAMELMRRLGVPVEEGTRTRAVLRLAEARTSTTDAEAVWALALSGQPADIVDDLLSSEEEGEESVSARAQLVLALEALGRVAKAVEVAARLERTGRAGSGGACFSDRPCDASSLSPPVVKSTALSALALAAAKPRSRFLVPALRAIAGQALGAGRAAGGESGLAALALAGWPSSTSGRLRVESLGRRLAEFDLTGGEKHAGWPVSSVSLLARSAPVAFVADLGGPPAPTARPSVQRTYAAVGHAGGRIGIGDEVRVEIEVQAPPSEAIEIRDVLPSGLVPILHPGDKDPLLAFHEAGGHRFITDSSTLGFDLAAPKGVAKVIYLARAAFAGEFTAPPVEVVGPGFRGFSKAQRLTVDTSR
jgi:alpha-2-macroglobulin